MALPRKTRWPLPAAGVWALSLQLSMLFQSIQTTPVDHTWSCEYDMPCSERSQDRERLILESVHGLSSVQQRVDSAVADLCVTRYRVKERRASYAVFIDLKCLEDNGKGVIPAERVQCPSEGNPNAAHFVYRQHCSQAWPSDIFHVLCRYEACPSPTQLVCEVSIWSRDAQYSDRLLECSLKSYCSTEMKNTEVFSLRCLEEPEAVYLGDSFLPTAPPPFRFVDHQYDRVNRPDRLVLPSEAVVGTSYDKHISAFVYVILLVLVVMLVWAFKQRRWIVRIVSGYGLNRPTRTLVGRRYVDVAGVGGTAAYTPLEGVSRISSPLHAESITHLTDSASSRPTTGFLTTSIAEDVQTSTPQPDSSSPEMPLAVFR